MQNMTTGLATLPFKSVLAKFRGPLGSVALLTVVDSAAALKAGQEPQVVGVQRFRSSATMRRPALPAKELPNTCVAPAAASSQPVVETYDKSSSFAPVPRDEQDVQDSGLCSPYSDPGEAVSDRAGCRVLQTEGAEEADDIDASAGTSGAISIDSLHNRLLERLFGVNMNITTSSTSSTNQTANESSISGVAPSVTLLTPAHDLTPSGAGSSMMSHVNMQPTCIGTGHGIEEEKFRCLVANTSYGVGIHSFPTRVTGASTRSVHDASQHDVTASRSTEFGKRMRSPNAHAALPQNRSDKRMRCHDQDTAGPSLNFTAPPLSNATTDTFTKPSRSTGPRKPAVPKFTGTAATGRSASAPKGRPVLQERRLAPMQQQTTGRTAVPCKKVNVRVSVTIHAQGAKSLATSTSTAASTRHPMRANYLTNPHKTASPPQSRQVRPKTAEKRKIASPRNAARASVRTRRSEGGGGRVHATSAMKQDLDSSLEVYADVGRAVTSLMHKLSKTPDSKR